MQKKSINPLNEYNSLIKIGISHVKNNQYEEAKIIFKKAIEHNSKQPYGYLNLSNLYLIENKVESAQELLFQYISDIGFNEEIVNHLGKICLQFKQYDQLKKLFLSSKLNINKKTHYQHTLFFLRGRYYEELSKINEAIKSYKKSIKCNKNFEPAYISLLNLLESVNDFENLEKFINTGLNLPKFEKKYLLIYYKSLLLYRLNRFEESETIIKKNKLEKKLINNNFFNQKLLDLRAKNNEKLKNHKTTFKYIEQRNNFLYNLESNRKFDKKIIFETIDKYSKFYNSKNLRNIPIIKNKTKNRLFFLVGFPRSGTTLLDTILRTHSKITVLEERPYLLETRHKFFRENNNRLEALKNITAKQIHELRDFYFNKINFNNISEKEIIVDKLPLSIIELGFIKIIFPESKIILALRHPCDVVISCFFSYFKINEAMINFLKWDDTINFYNKTFELLENYEDNFNINYHRIRYEDLILNFKNQIHKLLEYVGLKYENELENYIKTAKKREKISTPSYSQVIKPLYTSSIGRWENFKDIRNPEKNLIKWIHKFNY